MNHHSPLSHRHILIISAFITLALGGIVLSRSLTAQAASCTATTGLGTLTQKNLTSTGGSQQIWIRMQAADATNNTVGVEVTPSGGSPTCFTAGGTGLSSTGWTWKKVGVTTMTTTNNQIRLVGLQPNVMVDRVLMYAAGSICAPELLGDNCATVATASPTPTPTATRTPSPSVVVTRSPSPSPVVTGTPIVAPPTDSPTATPIPGTKDTVNGIKQ